MKIVRCAWLSLILGSFLMLAGCGWLASFYKDAPGGSEAQKVQNAIKDLPYGGIASLIIGAGGLLFGGGTHVVHRKKHKKSQAEIAALKAKLPAA